MTFREEYRKSNDSVHAPISVLESIKEKSAETGEKPIPLFETKPKRRWISIATYSGVAVAAAALVLLIFNPFRSSKNAAPAAMAVSEANQAETMLMSSSMVADVVAESDSIPAAGSLVSSFSSNSDSRKATDLEDGEPEEMFAAVVDDLTYQDIYSMLSPSERKANDEKKTVSSNNAPVLLTKESSARFSGNTVIAGELTIELPSERHLIALADLSGKILAVSEFENCVYITVIEKIDGNLVVSSEASQSGLFESCALQDSTVFEEDELKTYQVFEVISTYTVDFSAVSENDPETFCPVISDSSGVRPLDPQSINLYEPSDTYIIYSGYECSDNLRILYAFAEFGLD